MHSPMDYRMLERAIEQGGAAAELFGTAAVFLEEIASTRHELRAVRHPLGFLCLPVLRDGDRGICVHIFEPDLDSGTPHLTTSPVHSHSWELTSCILYGEVGNLRIRLQEQPAEPTHRIFEVHSSPSGVDEIRPTPRLVRSEPGPEQSSVRGEIYRLLAGEFHATVVPDGRPAATLVLGRSLPRRADLSLGPVHGRGHRVVRRTCDATQTARTARTALRRLHEQDPERQGRSGRPG